MFKTFFADRHFFGGLCRYLCVLKTINMASKKTKKSTNLPQMTLTVQDSDEVQLKIAIFGTGTMKIDWGDGMREILTSSKNDREQRKYAFSHTYLDKSTRKITISGKYIFLLYCPDNQITNLDVSQNYALKYLDCHGNPLENLDLSKNTMLKNLHCGAYVNISKKVDLSEFSFFEKINKYEECVEFCFLRIDTEADLQFSFQIHNKTYLIFQLEKHQLLYSYDEKRNSVKLIDIEADRIIPFANKNRKNEVFVIKGKEKGIYYIDTDTIRWGYKGKIEEPNWVHYPLDSDEINFYKNLQTEVRKRGITLKKVEWDLYETMNEAKKESFLALRLQSKKPVSDESVEKQIQQCIKNREWIEKKKIERIEAIRKMKTFEEYLEWTQNNVMPW